MDYTCKRCGKGFAEDWRKTKDKKHPIPDFCSFACAHARIHTSESCAKTASTLRKSPVKMCNQCGSILRRNRKMGFCKNCLDEKRKLGESLATKETRAKLSAAVRIRVANGTHNGWSQRSSKLLSFPEKYYIQAFDLRGYKGKYLVNHPIPKKELGLSNNACYFLDFYFPEKKIDVEIDGKQHTLPENTAHDKIRDEALQKAGIQVIRLSWVGVNTESNKQRTHEILDQFFSRFGSVVKMDDTL